MQNNNGADFAVNLPNQFPSVGDLMQQQHQEQRQDQQRQQQLNIQNQKDAQREQEQNRLYNLREIDSDTDVSKYRTGVQKIDDYAIHKLSDIKNNAIANYVKLSPEEAEYRLTQDLKPFVEWHGAAKNGAAQIDKTIKDLNTSLPNIDIRKAGDVAMNAFVNDYFERDGSGQFIPKSTNLIPERNYADIFDDNTLASLVTDTSPFDKEIHSLPTSTISESDMDSKKGFKKGRKWTAKINDLSLVTPNKEGLPELDVKHEAFPLPNGTSLKLMDEGALSALLAKPAVKISLQRMYEDEKQRKGLKFDPSVDKIMFRKFAYDQVNQRIPHGVTNTETQTIPTPRITVNVNGGSKKNETNDFVSRFKQARENGTAQDMVEIARELYSGNGSGKFQNMKVDPDDKGISISYTDANGDEKEEKISASDPNFYFRVAGLYQKLTGSDAKFEKSVLSGKKNLKNAPAKKIEQATNKFKDVPKGGF